MRIRVNQISQEKLDNRVKVMLEDAHVLEHSRAQFLHDLCKEIDESPNPKFTPVKPHVKNFKKDSWIIAMQIVSKYLQALKLDITKDTFDIETKKQITPTFYTHGMIPVKIDENAIRELINLKMNPPEENQTQDQVEEEPF
ncbi:hypothetical protein TVAG_409850 [Trichomonas vaginalis G3]|uniref:LisH domain-containing protein n=1 Tax=Trichomonas vaginalis (strain ATCC PRA-98 / G3) TaxID=412133 RepID=A2F8E5_TRIV3|nr:hypothetical protein TVAGG3_0365420 [Trichomonas vaginalis G3]EAX98847.1 hypothetical protein TVAG_409850 [Trichomonas vaginalis G3]KAI5532231.1 hypothetical protein TVAGG3_0365420 [Trichomonas vaginalis G3]|eukprot:XP_001311777.1 hypothetical protein [Trichomonas vaginalis G3]